MATRITEGPSKRRTVTELVAESKQAAAQEQHRLGSDLRLRRRRRRLSQQALAKAAGLSRQMLVRMELGLGGSVPNHRWHAVAFALGTKFSSELGRDQEEATADAGHLAIQELLLRLGATAGFGRAFELPTKPVNPSLCADVAWRDDARRVLTVLEAWNSIGDVGSGRRSFTRKLAEAEDLATARWGTQSHRVVGCWVICATQRNRALIARYPEVFGSAFPGSSAAWARALSVGEAPPDAPGLVWCDVACTRVFAWRRPSQNS